MHCCFCISSDSHQIWICYIGLTYLVEGETSTFLKISGSHKGYLEMRLSYLFYKFEKSLSWVCPSDTLLSETLLLWQKLQFSVEYCARLIAINDFQLLCCNQIPKKSYSAIKWHSNNFQLSQSGPNKKLLYHQVNWKMLPGFAPLAKMDWIGEKICNGSNIRNAFTLETNRKRVKEKLLKRT